MDDASETRGDFDTLLFDVKYALAKSIHTPKKFTMEGAEPLAKDVVAHLRLSRWQIEREPPIGGHGGASE